MNTGFTNYHPAAQLIFFVSAISFTMFIMHPIMLMISLVTASLYVLYSGGLRAFIKSVRITFLTSVMVIIINPLISHQGITVITYLPDGNPLTVESFLFGIAAALLMSCTLKWFYSVNRIFTSDRVIYLFGKITPKLALLISMTLNFVSKFTAQLKIVRAAQYSLGRDITTGSVLVRIKNGIRILSAMIQWSLENSIDTADSMKSRGYGLKKRTSFSLFRIVFHDVALISVVLIADIYMILAYKAGTLEYSYYPFFEIPIPDFYTISTYVVFAFLCALPMIIDIREDRKWKSIRSKI